ncbi:uncharacterized protein LOC129778713 [Toxorhynchites rutilus septentrionalis]|uniref:uncharacterized protein LOC129778713 n=1 Tax=Toxorhynchites rutilus septentrionalis TaxID=329112 RepID=UPI00247855F7|nr:uncharacterized protein LOC129778713 [Toxorhynchites rutilus septentrionalis]
MKMQHMSLLFNAVKHLHGVRRFSTTVTKFRPLNEVLKTVEPYSKIRIRCNCNLDIVPYDLIDCPDSNLLKFTADNASFGVNIDVNGREVNIVDNNNGSSKANCTLEIPVQADLDIVNAGDTYVSNLYSDNIRIEAEGNIVTKCLRNTTIDLRSSNGNISCEGITLAQTIKVVTTGRGEILLDKLQGGEVEAETNYGNIHVNSSYSNRSRFSTQNGDLILKNIHKLCQVKSCGPGKLIMNGFYGTLEAEVASQEVALQLSETLGESSVIAKSAENFDLAISDIVSENAEICIECDHLAIDPTLSGGKKVQTNEPGKTVLGKRNSENRLKIVTKGTVSLRKMSWTDSFGFDIRNEE